MTSTASPGSRSLSPTAVWSSAPRNRPASATGTSGTKIGNAHLKWAFSEAAVLFLRTNPAGQKYLARLEKKHGKGKALTILAHKLARAVYYMLSAKRRSIWHSSSTAKGAERMSLTPHWTTTG